MTRNIVVSDRDHRFAALLQRPHPVRNGTEPTPVTIRMEPFGKLLGDWYEYTQRPGDGKSRFPKTGTGPGGVAFLQPELDIRYVARDLLPMDNAPVSETYVVAAGCNWAAGIPDLTTGGVRSGYSWNADTGSLEFWHHNSMGVPNVAVRFGASGNISWKASTAFWGTLTHTNTADHKYTFQDADGTVAFLSDIPGGGLPPDRVVVTDPAGTQTTDDRLQYVVSSGTLAVGLASGTTGQLKLWSDSSIFETILQAGAASGACTYTLPTNYPAATDCALACDLTGTMSWQRFASYGSGVLSLTGTANRVSVSAATGNVTLTLPDDIYLGAASTTTGSLRLYNAGGAKYTKLQPGAPASDLTFTLPITAGTQYQVPGSDGSGVIAFRNAPRSTLANHAIEAGTVAFAAGTTTVAVAFASAFSAAPVVVCGMDRNGTVQGAGTNGDITVNGFTMRRSSGTSAVTGHWIAYGTKA